MMRPPHLVVALLVVVALSLPGVVAADSSTAIDHAGDGLTLDAVDGEHIHGTTSLAPGTLIGVRVKSVGDTYPFLVSKAVHVGESGGFNITFDLSEMAQLRGGPVRVSVRRDQQPIYEEDTTPVVYYISENSMLTPDIRDVATAGATFASTTVTVNSSSGIDVPGLGAGVSVAALLVAPFVTAHDL